MADELIDRLQALGHTQAATYRALVEHLRAALGTDGQHDKHDKEVVHASHS